MKRNIESIVFTNAVKKDRMRELINYAFVGSKATKINVYIDLYPIIRSMYADSYQVVVDDYIGLSAYLINLCGHYRSFFKYFYRVDTVFYLVMGKNCPGINNQLVPNYNAVMNNRLMGPIRSAMDEISNTNIGILNILCPYLPDIHFINTEYETGVVMGYLIKHQLDKSIPNLVISKDIYPLQLVAEYPNTYYIRPYKDEYTKDVSPIIKSIQTEEDADKFWKYYFSSKNVKRDNTLIHPINISTVMAFSGLPERSIKSRINLQTTLGMIAQLIGNSPTECSIDSIYNAYDLNSKVIEIETINRYHAINIPYQVEAFYENSVEAKTMRLENKHDDAAVRMISSKYFVNTPINLERL